MNREVRTLASWTLHPGAGGWGVVEGGQENRCTRPGQIVGSALKPRVGCRAEGAGAGGSQGGCWGPPGPGSLSTAGPRPAPQRGSATSVAQVGTQGVDFEAKAGSSEAARPSSHRRSIPEPGALSRVSQGGGGLGPLIRHKLPRRPQDARRRSRPAINSSSSQFNK